MQQAFIDRDNQIKGIQYENIGLQGETLTKRLGCFLEKALYGIYIYPIYLHAGSIAAEGTAVEKCWLITKVMPYIEMEIFQMPLSRINSEQSIGKFYLIQTGQDISS